MFDAAGPGAAARSPILTCLSAMACISHLGADGPNVAASLKILMVAIQDSFEARAHNLVCRSQVASANFRHVALSDTPFPFAGVVTRDGILPMPRCTLCLRARVYGPPHLCPSQRHPHWPTATHSGPKASKCRRQERFSGHHLFRYRAGYR